MKILGLDYGERRIGYAVADTTVGIAFGRDVIENNSFDNVLVKLSKIIAEEDIDLIVIGLPVFLSGTVSEQTVSVKNFTTKLQKKLNIDINYVDERLSTIEAQKRLNLQNFKAKDQKGKKDVIAAEIILQQFLDTNS